MKLNQLSDNAGAHKSKKRLGRGIGSGKGKTCGRGQKGQKSRSGVSINGFEGGQNPIYRRQPKRGFNNLFRKENSIVNIGELQRFIDSGKLDISKKIGLTELHQVGLISNKNLKIKLLAKGDIKSKITIEVSFASDMAKKKIKNASGELIISS